MWFDGKHVNDILPEEIEALITDKTPEDGMLDFKKESYSHSDGDCKEVLRDIVSFANADGGYIILGMDEINHRASGLCNIPQAIQEASRLRDLCLQCIRPRIYDLEILPRSIPSARVEIIVIHIPESVAGPFMVTRSDNTHFWRRYQDRKRPMSYEEIEEAFGRRRGSTRMEGIEELSGRLGEYLSLERAKRLERLAPTDSTKSAMSADEVAKIMQLRFRQQIGDNPYFRMASMPESIQSLGLVEHRKEIEGLLLEPPRTRRDGWVIWSGREIKRTPEGWVAAGLDDRMITLLDNGYLEYWQRCDDDTFQWGKHNSTDPTPELFPFAVCELPVNFLLLARKIYDLAGLESTLTLRMDYANIRGFALRPGAPNSMIYMMPAGGGIRVKGYEQNEISAKRTGVKPDFDAASWAFPLVEELYSAFGYPRRYIPCFTKDRQFDINVNSAED